VSTFDEELQPSQTLKKPVTATSTLKDAFSDIYNLYIVLLGIGGIAIMLFLLFRYGFNFLSFILLLISLVMLVLQLWGMFTIRITVSEKGVDYHAGYRNVKIEWKQIELVHIENWKKQITFWINGKLIRIHEFGLNPKEESVVREALLHYLKIHEIPMK
jgi:hypothetical protein